MATPPDVLRRKVLMLVVCVSRCSDVCVRSMAVVRGNGAATPGLPLGGARQQLVLAMLLAEANTVVSTEPSSTVCGPTHRRCRSSHRAGLRVRASQTPWSGDRTRGTGLRGTRRRLVARLSRVRNARQPGPTRAGRRRHGGCGVLHRGVEVVAGSAVHRPGCRGAAGGPNPAGTTSVVGARGSRRSELAFGLHREVIADSTR